MTINQTKAVVDSLSEIIASELQALSTEYWQPRLAADQMDSELAFRKRRVEHLRALRAEFENIMFGMERDAI